MKRSQVVAHITRWEGKGALYIVAHAKFQKSRGRNASEPYKGEFNPFKALKLALTELKTFDPMCGSYIPASIAQMVGVAKFTNQEVTGVFNGISITATPKSHADTLAALWNLRMFRRQKEYHDSPEYKQQQEERAAEVAALQTKVGGMMQLLETLDFNDLEAVINWFDEMQEASDDVSVAIPREQIVQAFQTHGYQPGVNCEDQFNAEDKENVARYLVGQALSCLDSVGSVHPMYKDFANDWRQKFLGSATETEPVS